MVLETGGVKRSCQVRVFLLVEGPCEDLRWHRAW